MSSVVDLPSSPPFTLRARLLTPLDGGGSRYLDDAHVDVDDRGYVVAVAASREAPSTGVVVDVRPWVAMPGMIDLHVHLPQIPMAGLGAGLELLDWLDRHIFPLERRFDRATARAGVPEALRALAGAGTTTMVAYGASWSDSTDECFAAAERHGIRAVIGKVMMDRFTYDDQMPPTDVLEVSLKESAELCERWHGRDDGRLAYAFTPRFAVSCTEQLLRESARLANQHGAYWQTHLSEDRREVSEVRRLFPDASDYLEVYERAGGVGDRAILAHAIHLSDEELGRLAVSGAGVAHCPASNLFLASGLMQAARYVDAGIPVGLGSDLAAGPELSLFSVMRAAATTQRFLQLSGQMQSERALGLLDWLRLGTLDGARTLGIDDRVGSIEVGKEADLILVDPHRTAPVPSAPDPDDPDELLSRLIFRPDPQMVRGAWVRGRLLPT